MTRKPNLKLFSDVDFSLSKNSVTDDLKMREGLYSIVQSIKNIALTSPGERPFSDLGANLYQYFWGNLTFNTALEIRNRLSTAINQYEPRVRVRPNDIKVTKNGSSLEINIKYALANDLSQNNNQEISIVVTEG